MCLFVINTLLYKILLIHGYAMTNLWQAGKLPVKRNRVCYFPGVRVDCHDKKNETKIGFVFLLCFRTNANRKFAPFSCCRKTKWVILSTDVCLLAFLFKATMLGKQNFVYNKVSPVCSAKSTKMSSAGKESSFATECSWRSLEKETAPTEQFQPEWVCM